MINAKNITPGLAIGIIEATFLGNLALMEEDPKVNILSFYLEGEPGVGKSAVPKALSKRLNYYLMDIRSNQMSPDDAGGSRMPNYETMTTDWFAPYWMPNPDGSVVIDGHRYDGTILFFDELASSDDRVRKPLFGAFLDRGLNGRPLPKNTLVIAAGNEAETGTMVFELDNATRTRFITYRIVADFTSWMTDYAPAANITPTVVAFIKNNLGYFCMTEKALQQKLDLYGNPRSWEHVSIIERSIMRTKEDYSNEVKLAALEATIAGKIGVGLAAEFMAVFNIIAKMTTLYDLIQVAKKDPSKLKQLWPKDVSQLYALAYSMMSYPKDEQTTKDVLLIMENFPDNTALPFMEMKPAIVEVVSKRLKEGGMPQDKVGALLAKESKEVAANMEGPLIKISLN